jgi:hypothetical protein
MGFLSGKFEVARVNLDNLDLADPHKPKDTLQFESRGADGIALQMVSGKTKILFEMDRQNAWEMLCQLTSTLNADGIH